MPRVDTSMHGGGAGGGSVGGGWCSFVVVDTISGAWREV